MSMDRRARAAGIAALVAAVLATACTHRAPAPRTAPAPAPDSSRASAHETELDQRVARLELRLLERDAQVEELQSRLDDARREVVRVMEKVQTLATRAEAASGMAEAEIALQPLAASGSQPAAPEYPQVRRLLDQSTAAFDKSNYGGALYLANQAKSLAGVGMGRLAGVDRNTLRPGEVPFAVPLKLQTAGHANVREGPGTSFHVTFTLDAGAAVVAYAYSEEWVRITDDGGRSGWVFRTRIGPRPGAGDTR